MLEDALVYCDRYTKDTMRLPRCYRRHGAKLRVGPRLGCTATTGIFTVTKDEDPKAPSNDLPISVTTGTEVAHVSTELDPGTSHMDVVQVYGEARPAPYPHGGSGRHERQRSWGGGGRTSKHAFALMSSTLESKMRTSAVYFVDAACLPVGCRGKHRSQPLYTRLMNLTSLSI